MAILNRGKKFIIAAVLLLALFAPSWQVWAREAMAQPLELFEEKIKAGLVYNFLKYTTWPAESAGEKGVLRVCLFGSDPFNGYLSPLAGRHAQQSIIDIVRVDKVQDTSRCNLVFISRSEEDNMSALLDFLKGKHVLTVSDIGRFARQGGMVELVKENQQIVFYINTKAVNLAGLNIEGRLLKLAKLVPG